MVQGERFGNLAASIAAGNFSIVSGVLPKEGGDDEGPNPHELVEAALAACTIITVQMYANRKQIKLNSTHVKVEIQSESKEKSSIKREIRFDGDLSEEEKKKLMEIANKCPIHKLLESQITIESKQV